MSGLLGGVISHLVAEKVFGAAYFGHIEYFPGLITYQRGSARRPDFLGLPAIPHGQLLVVESKGRSGSFRGNPTSKAVRNAKQQVSTVRSVRGFGTIVAYAQFTHFDRWARLGVDLFDPPGPDEAPNQPPPSVDLRLYYRSLVIALSALESVALDLQGIAYRFARYPLLDIIIGVPEAIYEAVTKDEPLLLGTVRALPPDAGNEALSTITENDDLMANRPFTNAGTTHVIIDIGLDGVVVAGEYLSGRRARAANAPARPRSED
ncbi:hypothetical protein [Gordonia sputi]